MSAGVPTRPDYGPLPKTTTVVRAMNANPRTFVGTWVDELMNAIAEDLSALPQPRLEPDPSDSRVVDAPGWRNRVMRSPGGDRTEEGAIRAEHRAEVVGWMLDEGFTIDGGLIGKAWSCRSGHDFTDLEFWPTQRTATDTSWIAILGHHSSGENRRMQIGQCDTLADVQSIYEAVKRISGYPSADQPVEPASDGVEVCVCAAVRLDDGRVIHGHRHDDVIAAVNRGRGERDRVYVRQEMQGFVTSRGRYVGRAEAYRLQLAAGVQSKDPGGYHAGQLYSEDLY